MALYELIRHEWEIEESDVFFLLSLTVVMKAFLIKFLKVQKYLKYGHNSPQEGIKVFSVALVFFVIKTAVWLFAELASEQVHPEDATRSWDTSSKVDHHRVLAPKSQTFGNHKKLWQKKNQNENNKPTDYLCSFHCVGRIALVHVKTR